MTYEKLPLTLKEKVLITWAFIELPLIVLIVIPVFVYEIVSKI